MKFSIVTPALNMEAYISTTINSVLSQKGDFDVEYIIVNDGSTDKTEEIVLDIKKRLEQKLIPLSCNSFEIKYISQKNQGMYGAINNGFSIATGDIYAWIGGDDIYTPTAFQAITNWFNSNTQSEWVKGMCGLIDWKGNITREGVHRVFYQDWVREGVYGRETFFIEQESVFWKSKLWKRVAPIPTDLRAAGDYWLWIEFAKHTNLDSIPHQVAYFRVRPGQISSNKKRYQNEQYKIYPSRSFLTIKIRIFSILLNRFSVFSKLWKKLYPLLLDGKRCYN